MNFFFFFFGGAWQSCIREIGVFWVVLVVEGGGVRMVKGVNRESSWRECREREREGLG